MHTLPVEIDGQRSAKGGDCELDQQGVRDGNAYPGWDRPKGEPKLGFGNRTILR
jgi:hypothetical protein